MAYERSHGGHPVDASGDPLAVDAEGCRDLAGIAAVGKVQDDGRSLDMVRQGSARTGERGQGETCFFSQGQRHRGGFARHKASSGMVTKRCCMARRPWSGQHGSKCGSLSIRCRASASDWRWNRQNHSPVWRCQERSKQSRLTYSRRANGATNSGSYERGSSER